LVFAPSSLILTNYYLPLSGALCVNSMDHNEVKNILKNWLNGSLDSHEWDDFISVKNKDAELEAIRQKAEGIWVENSVFLQPRAIDPCKLSELGRTEVENMIATMLKMVANG